MISPESSPGKNQNQDNSEQPQLPLESNNESVLIASHVETTALGGLKSFLYKQRQSNLERQIGVIDRSLEESSATDVVNRNTAKRMLIPGRSDSEKQILDDEEREFADKMKDRGKTDEDKKRVLREVQKIVDAKVAYGYHALSDGPVVEKVSSNEEEEAKLPTSQSLRPVTRRERRVALKADNKMRANFTIAASNRRLEAVYNMADPASVKPEFEDSTPEIGNPGVRNAVDELLRREGILTDKQPAGAVTEVKIGTSKHRELIKKERLTGAERRAVNKYTRKYLLNSAKSKANRYLIKEIALGRSGDKAKKRLTKRRQKRVKKLEKISA